jgi:hypothetical protein
MNRDANTFIETEIRRFYTITSALYALSVVGPAILTSAGARFGFMFTSFDTALSMYVPLGLLLVLMTFPGMPGREIHFVRWPTILFCCISAAWLMNYLVEMLSDSSTLLNDYDNKRIWFFIYGFMFPGIIGIAMSRNPIHFMRCFFPSIIFVSAVSSLTYLANYDSLQLFARLLEDQALLPGIIASWGASACLALLVFREKTKSRYSWYVLGSLFILQYSTVIISGTRMAIITFSACMIMFGFIAFKSKAMIIYATMVLAIVAASIEFMEVFVSAATMSRLMSLQESGSSIRGELVGTILRMISENPLGKIMGYQDSPLGMDYSHNTILQMIAEAGLQVVPALILVFWLVSRNVRACRKNPYYQGMFILGINVSLQSCSSGSAYNPFLWFLIFFMASVEPMQAKGQESN